MLRPQDISLRMPWDEPVRAKWTTKSTELAIETYKKDVYEAFRQDPTNEMIYHEYKKLFPEKLENIRGLPKPPEDNWRDFIPKSTIYMPKSSAQMPRCDFLIPDHGITK